MKISEIIREDVSAAEQLSHGLGSNLVPVLTFLKNRSADKDLAPKMRTDSLIQMVQNAGDNTFTYESLVAAYEEDEAVKELIKSFNKHEIILKSDLDHDDSEDEMHGSEENDAEQHGGPEDPTVTVDNMASRAAKNRG